MKTETERKCNRCKETKNLEDFHKCPSDAKLYGREGRRRTCKACMILQRKEWYWKKGGREIDLARAKRDYANGKRPTVDPEKNKIRKRTQAAVRAGKLVRKPCEVCGEEKVHAHHKTYDAENPFDIQWLCARHHGEAHSKYPYELTNLEEEDEK